MAKQRVEDGGGQVFTGEDLAHSMAEQAHETADG
jgi:hypothetical protein